MVHSHFFNLQAHIIFAFIFFVHTHNYVSKIYTYLTADPDPAKSGSFSCDFCLAILTQKLLQQMFTKILF